jgi:hypothetical protein
MNRSGTVLPTALAVCAALTTAIPSALAANAFLNLSTRGRVDSGENVLIGGLVVETRSNVLIRGMGPTLGPLGVAHPLAAARLTLFDRSGRALASNTDWRLAIPATLDPGEPPFPGYDVAGAPVGTLRAIMAGVSAFAPGTTTDAALYVELPPGTYTVHLASADGAPGVGLVEAYLVPAEVDPFSPSGRVRTAPETGYAPPLDGPAPASPVPDAGVRTLELTFAAPVTWTGVGANSGPTSRVSLPFGATGTRDPQHGRAGMIDSRGWFASPRFTKTAADTALVSSLATPASSAATLTEEFTLTFTSLAAGTFTYAWRETGSPTTAGTATGTFVWTREPPPSPATDPAGRFFRRFPQDYSDGRPSAAWAVRAEDHGRVLRHGSGPNACDVNGAREPIVVAVPGGYVLHYDGCAVGGWRACRAVSTDLLTWSVDGPVLELGPAGSIDAGAAASPWVIEHGGLWHMFYLATPLTTGAPDYIPFVPYVTRRATAPSPLGPWTKQSGVAPFDPSPGTYYAGTAAPGHVFAHGGEFLQVFSAGATSGAGVFRRTLGLARTSDLTGAWAVDPAPLLPSSDQIENSSLYFEPANGLWFLFTNHVGIAADGVEYTDEILVYWSPDPTRFDPAHKAVVLDPGRCSWSKWVLGMPSVVRVGERLAVLYDGCPEPGYGHMRRDIGLAWLELPLQPPF